MHHPTPPALLDLHAHLDNSTVDDATRVARQRGVTLGIVEHAGTKENDYPVVISDDGELAGYLDMSEGKGVYRGVQAEWSDWTSGFSPDGLAKLDYILTDAMTFPGKDGQRVKLWSEDVESRVDMADRQAFMDRYVDWHVRVIEGQPIDILANVSWLPEALAADYEAYWTPARIGKVVDAAVKHNVALEVNSRYKLPKLYFLEIAKAARVKFSFGSNGRYPDMGKLDYCLDMADRLSLTEADLFVPQAEGEKAAQCRRDLI